MRRDGFTLLEIAMVLVIISLIIGAIAVGSSLIRNAEIQSIASDSERYISAIKAFQDKYSALPGDFGKAESFWPASGTCPTATITGTCNGDTNGLIFGPEQFLVWQHLSLAKMVEGTYTGVAGPAGHSDRIPGTNIPASQISGSGWGLVYYVLATNDLLYTAGDTLPAHVLWFGGRSTNGSDNEQAPVLTSEEADQIDHRLDDGFPGTGKIVAQINGGGSGCYDSASAYNLDTAGNICSLVFKTGY